MNWRRGLWRLWTLFAGVWAISCLAIALLLWYRSNDWIFPEAGKSAAVWDLASVPVESWVALTIGAVVPIAMLPLTRWVAWVVRGFQS